LNNLDELDLESISREGQKIADGFTRSVFLKAWDSFFAERGLI